MSSRAKRMLEAAITSQKNQDQPIEQLNIENETSLGICQEEENELPTCSFSNLDTNESETNQYAMDSLDFREYTNLNAEKHLVHEDVENMDAKDSELNIADNCGYATQSGRNGTENFDLQSLPSEDDDDSIKDPNYLSSSWSSCCSSCSSSNSTSSGSSRSLHSPLKNSEENISVSESQSDIVGQSKNLKEKKTRKRIRKESEWMKQKAKVLRNKGMEYVSCSKSKKLYHQKAFRKHALISASFSVKIKLHRMNGSLFLMSSTVYLT